MAEKTVTVNEEVLVMLPQSEGWFVKNVRDARWVQSPQFGQRCLFENPDEPFAEIGVNIAVLQPGQANCRYHREAAQENFLVLAGECLLLVNDDEQPLRTWDFVHCPPGVSHVFVGAGDGPCVILMMGKRPVDELYYPESAVARRHGAETPEPTPDPRVAYRDVERPRDSEPSPWW